MSNGVRKLTKEQAESVCYHLMTTKLTQRRIAEENNTNVTTVSRINFGASYRDVSKPLVKTYPIRKNPYWGHS